MCNLSEVVIRPDDTLATLKNKVRLATIIGTLQSTLTNFKYLRKVWKDNADEERLLGVSLTGIMDHPVMSGRYDTRDAGWWEHSDFYTCSSLSEVLQTLRIEAINTNREWSQILGIALSKQLTLCKPSGTVSQLVNCSSGIHPRYSKYYIRKVTQDNKDPLTQMMKDQGIPYQIKEDKTYFSFPIESPEDAITKKDISAIEQLELWKIYRTYWCDGNPSQTIYYTDKDFPEVQAWVWKNWDIIGGLSFFPVDDNVYEINPYNPCSKEEYQELLSRFPEIDWSQLSNYEKEDNTTSSQEVACAGGACEL